MYVQVTIYRIRFFEPIPSCILLEEYDHPEQIYIMNDLRQPQWGPSKLSFDMLKHELTRGVQHFLLYH